MRATQTYKNGRWYDLDGKEVVVPSSRLAEVLESCQAPLAKSDREFWQGRKRLADQPHLQRKGVFDRVMQGARAHGYNPGPNDFYQADMARFFGDPAAFVPPTAGRGHLEKLRERDAPMADVDPLANCVPLAGDLVKEQVNKRIKANPDLAHASPRKLADLREDVIETHGSTNKRFL